MATDQPYRVGAILRAKDGFVGSVVQPLGRDDAVELLQARTGRVTVYTLYRAETGEIRRYTRESLTLLQE